MRHYIYMLIATCLLVSSTSWAHDEKQIIVGYVENISIPAVDIALKAKLDTGATTSSIHAKIISLPNEKNSGDTKDEKSYVTFSIVSEKEETKNLKKEIVRFVRIKKKNGGTIRRPVIMMTFCVAGELVEEEVNLSDRDHFNYDVLIGRNMLTKANILVDASKTFTAKPNCVAEEPTN